MANRVSKRRTEGGLAVGTSLDVLTLVGVTLAVGGLLGGAWLNVGEIRSLLKLTPLLIVLGGTFGAVLIQSPLPEVWRAARRLHWILLPPHYPRRDALKLLLVYSRKARREGLMSLEGEMEREAYPLMKKGMQLLIDGFEPGDIRMILDREIDAAISADEGSARVYEAMGGYCPTIGILGAVIGLVDVMNNISQPSQLGAGIALAFVATIYGVGLANLFFLPVSNRLKAICRDRAAYDEMLAEGIVMIADGDTTAAIATKLDTYLY